ncbi:MAG: hypothetical protein ABIF28_07125 [Pseudomonadota bacterium]
MASEKKRVRTGRIEKRDITTCQQRGPGHRFYAKKMWERADVRSDGAAAAGHDAIECARFTRLCGQGQHQAHGKQNMRQPAEGRFMMMSRAGVAMGGTAWVCDGM